MSETKSEVKIEKRKISHSIVTDRKGKEYSQYRISLPKEFVETHGEDVYLIADSIGMIVHNEETLMKILKKFPEIREFVLSEKKKNVEKQTNGKV